VKTPVDALIYLYEPLAIKSFGIRTTTTIDAEIMGKWQLIRNCHYRNGMQTEPSLMQEFSTFITLRN
jgi:hypothetical protein